MCVYSYIHKYTNKNFILDAINRLRALIILLTNDFTADDPIQPY